LISGLPAVKKLRRLDGTFMRVALVILLCLAANLLVAQVSVTTYHSDNSRTGQNTPETTLTPANVNSGQFGKVFTTTLDGGYVTRNRSI